MSPLMRLWGRVQNTPPDVVLPPGVKHIVYPTPIRTGYVMLLHCHVPDTERCLPVQMGGRWAGHLSMTANPPQLQRMKGQAPSGLSPVQVREWHARAMATRPEHGYGSGSIILGPALGGAAARVD